VNGAGVRLQRVSGGKLFIAVIASEMFGLHMLM